MTKSRSFEIFQACELLKILDESDGLDFPICVEHRDMPDFVFSTRSRSIGVETSFFTDEEQIRAERLHLSQYPNEFAITTGLRDGPRRRSNEELLGTMFNAEEPAFTGIEEQAEHVSDKILERIRLKSEDFRSLTFDNFPENWLLLTDNSNLFFDDIADQILTRRLDECQRSGTIGSDFDRIYVMYGPRCFRLQQGKLELKLLRTSTRENWQAWGRA